MTDPYAAPTSYGNPPSSESASGARSVGRAGQVGAIAGIAFPVLFVLSFAILDTPEGDASDSEWVQHWLDSDNRAQGTVSFFTMVVAAAAFLWLLGMLRRRLPAGAIGRDAFFAAGTVYAALLFVASMGAGLIPLGNELADVPIPKDPDLIRMIDGLYFGTIFAAVPYAIAAMLFPLWRASADSGLLPKWLRIYTLVTAIVCLSGPFLFVIPHLLFLIWVLITSVLLLSRSGAAAAPVPSQSA